MNTVDITFLSSDNRRQTICRTRIQARSHIPLVRNYRGEYFLSESTLRKLIAVCFQNNSVVKFSRQENAKVSFVVMKKKSTYFINGDKISGKNLNKLMNFIFVKFNAYKNEDEIDDDVIKFQEIDPLISDVIINKLKYQYYSPSSNKFEETLLNMQIIGKDTVAFELYSDKWIPLRFKEAIQFIRGCKGGDNKFFAIPFQELYRRATGKFLTSSEEKVIDAFLLQNRSSTLVTKRSMELVEKLTAFPAINRVELFTKTHSGREVKERGLHIRGKGASWIVTHQNEEGKHILGRQNVKTQHMVHLTELVEYEKHGNTYFHLADNTGKQRYSVSEDSMVYTDGKNYFMLSGSICIDQMDYNISLGDQIASRSLLLMSDKDNIDKVSTLNGFARSMDLPRTQEVIKDGLLTLRQVKFTISKGRKLTRKLQ